MLSEQGERGFQSAGLENAFESNGGFLDSCFHHCHEWNQIIIRDMNSARALLIFYEAVVAQRSDALRASQYFYYQVSREMYSAPASVSTLNMQPVRLFTRPGFRCQGGVRQFCCREF